MTKGLILEVEAIMNGPCEACGVDNWVYRVLEKHTRIPFSRPYRWCEECLFRHAEEGGGTIFNRLTEEEISFAKKKTAAG